MHHLISTLILLLLLPVSAACQDRGGEPGDRSADAESALMGSDSAAVRDSDRSSSAPPVRPPPPLPGPPEEAAARAAWSYVEQNEHRVTGLVSATEHYAYLTTWDLGSVLAAIHAARRLDLIGQEEHDRRMSRVLETLGEMPLFDGAAFNKVYNAATGEMVDRRDRASETGYGWSVLDIARLLAWLKVVETRDPTHAAAARAVAERMDYDRLIQDGYLMGTNLRSDGRIDVYPEGRIAYEQYAAEAFRRWGHEAHNSGDLYLHSEPVDVLGHVILVDTRGRDRVTSEPFIMLGLEFGWSDDLRELAGNVLGAQRARYERTGTVTIVSEDAMTEAPHYFYYYCVYLDGETFVVDAQSARQPLDGPRWVSAKAAYGWHSLLPDEYTALAVETVAPALVEGRGWYSGVYEGSHARAGSMNLNTAAMILEALLYRSTGEPLAGPSR